MWGIVVVNVVLGEGELDVEGVCVVFVVVCVEGIDFECEFGV